MATKTSLNTIENKIPSVSDWVKKTDYSTKINEIEKKIADHNHDKYITIPEFTKLTPEIFAARLKQATFVNKKYFDYQLKNFDKKITSKKTKHARVENEFKKLKTFDSSLFIGQSYFNNDGAQLYLIFHPVYKPITTDLPNIISRWESKGLSNEKFQSLFTTNKILSQKLVWMNNSRRVLRLEGSCLKQEDTTPFAPSNVASLLIAYELDSWPSNLRTDFTLGGCIFGCVRLTKNADPDKYSYSGYGIGFDTCGYHSLLDGSVSKNVIIFGADMSSSVHIDNKGKDFLILGKGPTQGLNHTLTAETPYSINFTRPILFKPAL